MVLGSVNFVLEKQIEEQEKSQKKPSPGNRAAVSSKPKFDRILENAEEDDGSGNRQDRRLRARLRKGQKIAAAEAETTDEAPPKDA